MITLRSYGDFSKLTGFLEKAKRSFKRGNLDKYGRMGVDALRSKTPVDSGKTADLWYYEIEETDTGVSLNFLNSNINKGVPIAVILQYGHGTGTGGWVEGRDYINPALQPIFDKILDEMWKEVGG